jgi:ribonuclease E
MIMKHVMLINAVHREQKRMATVENGKLLEYNIQMSFKEPITGNIYKGLVQKVERGLQAAFVNYGGKKDGFLPLRDAGLGHAADQNGGPAGGRPTLKVGQEILVQIVREVSERKGALLTGNISLPGRYLVLLPNKQSSGISRKIEDEEDRKRLRTLVEQIKVDDNIGFIVRTAGMSRTKQELSRDYQLLSRLWKEIQKRTESVSAPAVIYQESDFGVCSLRDYFTSDIEEILVDDMETFRKVRTYCKAVAPRNMKIIKLYKEKTPLFDKYQLEEQIRAIYRERVELKSGGYIIINPTEAMITIDVNSGRASNKRNVEETAFKTNLEAAEEIARQLRLRDLGGLIVIDFIDMEDRKHEAEVEKSFKKAMSVDRARVQLSRISKFGILELSRQKKHSTIQEISYTTCPFCKGTGHRPSLEYTALSAFRKIESQAVKGRYSAFRITAPPEVADYLLNQKRPEISKIEGEYDVSIYISGNDAMVWDDLKMETTEKKAVPEPEALILMEEETPPESIPDAAPGPPAGDAPGEGSPAKDAAAITEGRTGAEKRRVRRRPRHRRKKHVEAPVAEDATAAPPESSAAEETSGADNEEAGRNADYLTGIFDTDG